MAFDRWTSWFECSRALTRFKTHHTEINDLYWSLAPAAGYSKYVVRHAAAGSTPVSVFHATGPNTRRLPATLDGWTTNFREFENWTRLSMLLSALSYLEAYISAMVTLSLRSDPLLRYGQPRTVDGVTWIKRAVHDDVSDHVLGCVKGQWSKRLSGYARLFGTVPADLRSCESDLERMRVIRNGVAHSFGRDNRFFEDPLVDASTQAERLSETTLLSWLGVIERAAIAVDEHLLPQHVGEFELLWHYHRWQALPAAQRGAGNGEWRAFSRHINRKFGMSPGPVFCRELRSYYDQL